MRAFCFILLHFVLSCLVGILRGLPSSKEEIEGSGYRRKRRWEGAVRREERENNGRDVLHEGTIYFQ